MTSWGGQTTLSKGYAPPLLNKKKKLEFPALFCPQQWHKFHHYSLLFYLKPTMGHSLQMLHLAWCLAVSAEATLWSTGNHTMDCGSKCIQSTNCCSSMTSSRPTWNPPAQTNPSFITAVHCMTYYNGAVWD